MRFDPEKITVICDSREKQPWDLFPFRTEEDLLTTGDYTIRGLEHVVRVERKTLPDLVGCVGCQRKRFEREVVRLLAYPVRILVVESTWSQIERQQYRANVHPNAVIGSLLGWQALGLQLILAGNRIRAQNLVKRLFTIVVRRRVEELRSLQDVIQS